jgi:hypothetical protein
MTRGAEHPETLLDRANFARWTEEAGDPAADRDQCAALLPVRERVSGAEHPGHPARARKPDSLDPTSRHRRARLTVVLGTGRLELAGTDWQWMTARGGASVVGVEQASACAGP